MLAMETLAKKVHEDRPQTKYAKNPPNGEDVKWLLHVSFKLGTRPSSHTSSSCVQNTFVYTYSLFALVILLSLTLKFLESILLLRVNALNV